LLGDSNINGSKLAATNKVTTDVQDDVLSPSKVTSSSSLLDDHSRTTVPKIVETNKKSEMSRKTGKRTKMISKY
jgi:hypothetical protein